MNKILCHTRPVPLAAVLLACTLGAGIAQIPVANLTDKTVYNDQRSFSVPAQAGFIYQTVTLNGEPIPVNATLNIDRMDHYGLYIERVPTTGGALQAQLLQFIILSSDRGEPERGLIQWTPYPSINSAAAEFDGASLQVVVPLDYPQGLEIPVVAWVLSPDDGQTLRLNGPVSAPGFESRPVQLRRGIGSGFLPAASAGGAIGYHAAIHSAETNKTIQIDDATTWTPVSGILDGVRNWEANSRMRVTGHLTIPAGSTLNIGEGTVVLLNPQMNITNTGNVNINGTTARPVVFTGTVPVKPRQHTSAWGGFFLRGGTAKLVANGAIFTGAGFLNSMDFSPGETHHGEQPLLLVHSGAQAYMTNCYVMDLAGQLANVFDSTFVFDHSLMQRAITAGEFAGGSTTVNHSTLIEFPEESGQMNSQIASADYDDMYFTRGTHLVLNSLLGFCKDDAMDAGSGGAGSVTVSNCWVEAAQHEALAWSGLGRVTRTYHTVVMNSGQGIECGWSDGASSPLVYANDLLSLGNSVGARFGDNYDWTYTGNLQVTNSMILNNYRDVWGYNWDDWVYRVAQMDVRDNLVTTANTNHPNNSLWNPAVHGARLIPFMRRPVTAPVGVGLALWTNKQHTVVDLGKGVPVRLSSFSSQTTSVDYVLESFSGAPLEQGTLTFLAGETLKMIRPQFAGWQTQANIRLRIVDPVNAEITGFQSAYYLAPDPPPVTTTLIPAGSLWKYLVTPTAPSLAWRGLGFDDTIWLSGAAELGFGESDQATTIGFGPDPNNKYNSTYFRRGLTIPNASAYDSLILALLRDDGGVVYINGTEVFRSPNLPPGPITYATRTTSTGENDTDNATFPSTPLVNGANVVAVEIHQAAADSSDLSFNLALTGSSTTGKPTLHWTHLDGQLVLLWNNPAFKLEHSSQADSGWSQVPGASSPWPVAPNDTRKFYRLIRN